MNQALYEVNIWLKILKRSSQKSLQQEILLPEQDIKLMIPSLNHAGFKGTYLVIDNAGCLWTLNENTASTPKNCRVNKLWVLDVYSTSKL